MKEYTSKLTDYAFKYMNLGMETMETMERMSQNTSYTKNT